MVEETGSRQGRKGIWEQTVAGSFLPEPAFLSSVRKDMSYAFCLPGFVGLLLLLLFLFETACWILRLVWNSLYSTGLP